MPRSTIPQGYAVVQLDDTQWYPLEILRFYSGDYPDGDIRVTILHRSNENREWVPAHYPHRDDALHHVQAHALQEQRFDHLHWQQFTTKSDVYPERCRHFLDLIEEITGRIPNVHRWMSEVGVSIEKYTCSCGTSHCSYWDSSQVTIEDALQRAAEYAYSHRCSCTATTAQEYEQRIAVNS